MVQLLEHPSKQNPSRPDVGPLLMDSLDLRWLRFRKELARCQKRFSEKSVHDLRVAIRRLVSTLDILMNAVPDDSIRKTRRMLKKHFSTFGPLRDTQVQILAAQQMVKDYPVLESFLTVLRLRERRLVRQLDRQVKKMRSETMEGGMSAIQAHLRTRLSDPVVAGAARAAAMGALAMAFTKAVHLHAAIDPSNSDTIHRLRIAFKKFRYMAEALHPMLDGVTDDMLKAMHDYQVRMGDIQDIELLITNIEASAKRRRKTPAPSLAAVRSALVRRRSELIEVFLTRNRELRAFWTNSEGMK